MPQEQAKTDCHIYNVLWDAFLQNGLPKMNWMTVKFGTFAEVFTGARTGIATEGNL